MKYVRVYFVFIKTRSEKKYFESQNHTCIFFYTRMGYENVKYFENFEPNFH